MAHSPRPGHAIDDVENWNWLARHIRAVTEKTVWHTRFLNGVPNNEERSALAGLLHDLGKYNLRFQNMTLGWDVKKDMPYLSRREKGPQHSQIGAALLTNRHSSSGLRTVTPLLEATLPILAHHGKLRNFADARQRIAKVATEGENSPEALLQVAALDFPDLEDLLKKTKSFADLRKFFTSETHFALYVRFMLSALVDADRLDAERHGSPEKADQRLEEDPEEMAQLFARFSEKMQEKQAQSSGRLNELRGQMQSQAIQNVEQKGKFFALSLPTGAGKTLTGLGAALRHAALHGQRRVIYVAPYITIIDQTAKVYREFLEEDGGDLKVLEHHSNFQSDAFAEDDSEVVQLDLLAENWDVPVVVTTVVRFFEETMFGTSKNQLRRLHNVSGSVIILDEAQSLPLKLLDPTLDGLRFLVEHCGCTVIFSTATPPVWSSNQLEAMGLSDASEIEELVPAADLAEFERVAYEKWDGELDPTTLAERLTAERQVLCVLNVRKYASETFLAMREKGLPEEEIFHLSTYMTPVHRLRTLAEIRERLRQNLPCRVVSTQLVEAGVDLDFPVVYRQMAPLDSILQAAGRCNREGRLSEKGRVVVFEWHENSENEDYRARTNLCRDVLRAKFEPDSALVFKRYHNRLFRTRSTTAEGWEEANAELDFARAEELYEIIETESVPVLIREAAPEEINAALEVLTTSHSREERRKAWQILQRHSVGFYRKDVQGDERLCEVHELVKWAEGQKERMKRGVTPPVILELPCVKDSPEFEARHYDEKLGLQPRAKA